MSESGQMAVVDFGDLSGLGPLAAGLMRRWLRLFHVTPRTEILQTLETRSSGHGTVGRLALLPGRYAFIWKCNRRDFLDGGHFHVAPQTQAGGNSRAPGGLGLHAGGQPAS
jgi:hypothetical protein